MAQRLAQFADNIISQRPKPITKEDVENVFYKILYDRKNFKFNDDKINYLREQFDSENPQLMQILKQH